VPKATSSSKRARGARHEPAISALVVVDARPPS
jgi:hypothetical protein